METNPQIELAFDFIQYTGTSVFLTGKAGTGKTTFLHELKRRSPKRMIVLAPTGVAAMNAGGVTIHSFFQLPFGPYLPGMSSVSANGENKFVNKFSREKINMIRSLDLLVIDEISMVRADLLDAVNDMLCRYRDRSRPFGGVQLLMIGDLQQLAPVAKEEEWELLKGTYPSAFFFSSRALQRVPYVSIELTQVYRQSDAVFIGLLNRIREQRADRETIEKLNRRYRPDFCPDDNEGYITLTTHNYQAQQINKRKLEELPGKAYTYEAEIEKEFPEYSYPTDAHLVLKKGAQVMFVKNDSSGEKRYYNGKIGKVTDLSSDYVSVKCGEEEAIRVGREEWTNSRYTIDSETREITETIIGVYRQYPLRAAWAITIHKSQGLTFERAIIDAAAAFTHGQVYVALSRCRTLEGLVLSSPLNANILIHNQDVASFTEGVKNNQPGEAELAEAQRRYYLQLLQELFDYQALFHRLFYVTKVLNENLEKLYPELTERFRAEREDCRSVLADVGERFKSQLERMVKECADYEKDSVLSERVEKGIIYFREHLGSLSRLLEEDFPEIDNKDIRKTVEEALKRLGQEVHLKMALLEAMASGFSVKEYLRVRAFAVMEQPARKKKIKAEKTKVEVSGDILHPELYKILREWRKEEAVKLKLPAYTVLHQKALLGVVNTLPTTGKELLAIPGIGKKVVERYGAMLLELVDGYRLKS